MAAYLTNKRILLGVTGSIAAYKSADLVRRLREAGAEVRVVMTQNAKQFITPLTMQAVSGNPVHDDLFDLQAEAAMGHIELARWADLLLIAPATADTMARLAAGYADDLLTTVALATRARVVVAPAMNQGMWKHTLTQTNRQALIEKNIIILGPAAGDQACGDVGPGRMLEPLEIVEKVDALFATDSLAGLHVLITAGPTREAIDPVRYITNGSSGKMGYALAEAAIEAGAKVTLISGPVSLPVPAKTDFISVVSAQEMYDAVMNQVGSCDIFLGVAAVADFRCKIIAKNKTPKDQQAMTLELERNPDILASVGQLSVKPFIVGFAAETHDVIAKAKAKREHKGADLIIANEVGNNIGMYSDDNQVTILGNDLEIALPLASKHQLARQLIAVMAEQYRNKDDDRKTNAA